MLKQTKKQPLHHFHYINKPHSHNKRSNKARENALSEWKKERWAGFLGKEGDGSKGGQSKH